MLQLRKTGGPMNTSIYNISLDLHEQISPKALYVKRGDTVRELRVTITEDGKPYEVTNDVTSVLCAILPTGSTVEKTMTRDGNILVAVLPSSWTATDGEMRCEVQLTSGTDSLLTPGFSVYVGHESGSIPTDARELPAMTSADNGKSAVAEDGEWVKGPNLVHIGESVEIVDGEVIKPVVGLNLFDEENNSHERVSVPESEFDWMYRIGTVYLDGYEGDLVISCKGQKHAYITELHVYDEDSTDMEVEFDEDVVNSIPNGARSGNLAEIPEGAVYLTFQYRVYNTDSSPLVEEVMVTKGDTITAYYLEYETTPIYLINAEQRIKRVAYVSTTGDDSDDGLTPETAFATFGRALEVSNIVFAERGVYNQSIDISGKHGVRITPYDNDEEFVSGTPRQMIELTGGDDYLMSELTLDDGLYKVDCENGLQFSAIFNPDYPEPLDPIAPNGAYRANVFVHLTTHGKQKLKPVLSKALCEAEDDTFWYDYGNKILWMNISTADFSSVTVLSRLTHLNIEDSSDIEIQDVSVKYNYSSVVKIDNSIGVTLTNCEASYSGTSMGFEINNSNVELRSCYATNNWYDGFNFHKYGQSEMFNCVSEFNWDDGCSHHNGCYGAIYGGEFNGNGKGGITPAYGANVNISGILAKGNDTYGVAYLSQSGNPPMKGLITSSAVVGNPTGIKVESGWTVNAVGLKYSGNTTDKTVSGALNEY